MTDTNNEPTLRALLTDYYQITMAYAYFRNGMHEQTAVFELFFRKHPFKGNFTVFAGLEQALHFIDTFGYTHSDIEYLRTVLPASTEDAFFEWLSTLDASSLVVDAVAEGTLVHPRAPLLRVRGPLAVAQLLESTLLNIVNFATLVATNAARHVLAAGRGKQVVEFGLRRAQGPNGAMVASRSAYIGGASGTSNVAAGKLYNIPVSGTHAHAFVTAFHSFAQVGARLIAFGPRATVRSQAARDNDSERVERRKLDLVAEVRRARNDLGFTHTNESELVAFTAYAASFPAAFTALVDTYDTLGSGVPNFLCVALALFRAGYDAKGIRLDSGDLSDLSKKCRALFRVTGQKIGLQEEFSRFKIVASNDLNEKTLLKLRRDGHEIDIFGIGTNLVTCQAQPALGGVYKLVEINGTAVVKLSEEVVKVTIPGYKRLFRLYGANNIPIVDVLTLAEGARKVLDREEPKNLGDTVATTVATTSASGGGGGGGGGGLSSKPIVPPKASKKSRRKLAEAAAAADAFAAASVDESIDDESSLNASAGGVSAPEAAAAAAATGGERDASTEACGLRTETALGIEPEGGSRFLVVNPFNAHERFYVTPLRVVELLQCVYNKGKCVSLPPLDFVRKHTENEIAAFFSDYLDISADKEYRVMSSTEVQEQLRALLLLEAPIQTLT